MGKVEKLSNIGWSYHHRLLKMDQISLAYYRNVPKDFDENSLKCPSVESGKEKPKSSIPIKKIISVSEIQEEDKKKYKKLSKTDVAFKVMFSKKHVVKKEYIPGNNDSDEQSDDDKDQDGDHDQIGQVNGRTTMMQSQSQVGKNGIRSKSKAKKDNKKSQNLGTWYFVCENKFQHQLWIEQIALSARQQNPKFILDESLMDRLKLNKSNVGNNINAAALNAVDEDDDGFDEATGNGRSDDELPMKTNQKGKLKEEKKAPLKGGNQLPIQQIDLFGKNRGQPSIQVSKKEDTYRQATSPYDPGNGTHNRSRTDSEFSDINQVLQQNLNINKGNMDADGNLNDMNANQRGFNDDDDGDHYYEDNQDAKERMNKLKNNIHRYFNASINLQDKKTKKEQKGWDLKFQNYWGYLISADKNLKDSMTLSERFFDHVGKFRRSTQLLVKEIVDELHKPISQRDHKPLQKVSEEHGVFLDDEDLAQLASGYGTSKTLLFFEKNIVIKITHQGESFGDSNPLLMGMGNAVSGMISANRTSGGANNNNSLDGSYMANTAHQQQQKNQDPFQNMKYKSYGRDFLSLDIMFDTLFLLSKPDAAHKLRVPLSALVDYKGFRALAVASIPIQPQLGPSIGFYTDGKYVPHDLKLKQELVYVGDVLNLKENRISQKGQSQFESVPVSFFIKIFNYQQPESKNKGKDPDTPTKKSQEHHFSELQYLEEPFYVLKTGEIFPYDSDLNELYPRKDKYLRPEFVCAYERPLKADARKDLGSHVAKDTKSKDDENDQVDLNEASRYLRTTKIPNLVNLLDSLIIMPIDSESLELTFHSQGVNMRYLGLVTSQSIVPHVRDICVNEMLARAAKNILGKQISAMILDHQKRWTENEEKRETLKRQWNNRHYMSQSQLNGGGPGQKRQQQNQHQSQQEYDVKEQELQEELEDLKKPMDDQVRMAIADYINLVFGAGDETSDFWSSVLLPYTSQYYNFPLEELQKSTKYLNALFFAFIYHFGLKIVKQPVTAMENNGQNRRDNERFGGQQQKDDDYFKEFGKSEQPFGPPEKSYLRLELQGRSKTYGLRNLSYKLLADKYREYKSEGKLENALKCCKMKRLMKRLLEGREDVATIADICEIALDHYEYKIAKEQAIEGLKHVAHQSHSEAIKFYCILTRAFYGMDFNQEADQYFSKALATLDHHWGSFHPLHTTVYGIMAHLLIQKNKTEEAKYLYQSSLLCCLRVLGPNHIQTAEVHMDFGRLFLRMKNKDEGLQHFEEAYLIYESYFGVSALPTANAAMQIATILEEQGKLNDALGYAHTASETYRQLHGDESEQTIFAQFLQLSISYSLKHPEVVEMCKKLYAQLVKRDQAMSNYSLLGDNQMQRHLEMQQADFEMKITKIKELCVATTILHVTRTLSTEEKQAIKSYCDKVLFRAHQLKGLDTTSLDDDTLPNLADLHQRIDQHKIMSLSNLKFDESGKNFLQQLYDIAKDGFMQPSLVDYYTKILDGVIIQVREEQKKQQNQNSQTKTNGGSANTKLEGAAGAGGPHNLVDNWPVTDEPKEFFKRLIKAFEHINFYNVLIL